MKRIKQKIYLTMRSNWVNQENQRKYYHTYIELMFVYSTSQYYCLFLTLWLLISKMIILNQSARLFILFFKNIYVYYYKYVGGY